MTAEAAASKAALLRSLQERLAALEKAGQARATNRAASPAPSSSPGAAASASPSPPAPTQPAKPALPATPAAPALIAKPPTTAAPPVGGGGVALSPLEQMKALLAAKLAAKDARLAGNAPPAAAVHPVGPTSQLSAAAPVFTPAAAAASASAAASVSAAPAAAAAAARGNAPKPLLCRSWLTCTFGSRCRFRHPTVAAEPFFDYGGRVLLHLNANTLLAAASAGVTDSPAAALASAAMPPVLLLVLALLVAARTDPTQEPSMSLSQLWGALREQLAGSRDLPSSQDDLLNNLGLPTTAAVLVRAADGKPVVSTEAFRNMYASVFAVTRREGTFFVAHQWDEPRRARLQVAAEAAEALLPAKKTRGPAAPASTTRSAAVSVYDDADADLNRKRKRVPDSEVYATDAAGPRSGKMSRLGEAYPEDEPAPAPAPAAAPRLPPPMVPGSVYSMDAGAEMGGTTSFVRGGIVTELSLLAPTAALRQQALVEAQAAHLAAQADQFEDAFTRAIRRQREVSTHATYTLHTSKISSGKGFDMLQRMNWRAGQGLGKRRQGRVEPLEVKYRADRTGL